MIGFTEVSLTRVSAFSSQLGAVSSRACARCFAPNLMSIFFAFRWRATATGYSRELCLLHARFFPIPNGHQITEVISSRISPQIRRASKGAVESASPALSPSSPGFYPESFLPVARHFTLFFQGTLAPAITRGTRNKIPRFLSLATRNCEQLMPNYCLISEGAALELPLFLGAHRRACEKFLKRNFRRGLAL